MKKQSFFFSAVATGLLLATGTVQAQWTVVGTSGFSPGGQSDWQHMTFDSHNVPYVSFNDDGLTGGQGTVMKYDGTSWNALGNAGFTPGASTNSSFVIDSAGNGYFSFADATDSSQVSVMKYNGSTWSSIGNNLSTGAGTFTHIQVSANGTPYISYIDAANGSMAYVRKYNGTSWDIVGGASVSPGPANYPYIAFDRHDSLYVVYEDYTDGGRARAKKYNGVTWDTVGASFLSEVYGGANEITMAFDHNNVPYVGYWNPYAGGPKVAVHKYNGTSWTIVGTPSFTTGVSLYTTLAIGNDDVPYIAYQDATATQQANVMKYDGTNWVYLGGAGLSAGASTYTSLAFDANGNPYVAYSDAANAQKTTVSKYTLCNTPSAAAPTASASLICKGDTVHITVAGTLHDAANWYWYTGSCGGALADSGSTVSFVPNDTTTYYVRGYGGCVVSSTCVPVTVNVQTVAQPTITANGLVLSSSAATGNQWYLNGTAIPGATAQTYTATANGNYTVQVTSGNCSNTSAPVSITSTGITNVSAVDGVQVYPVPFEQNLQLAFNAAISNPETISLKITDNTGRTVYNASSLKQTNTLDLQHLSPGIYFVHLTMTQGNKVFKVTKQ